MQKQRYKKKLDEIDKEDIRRKKCKGAQDEGNTRGTTEREIQEDL